MTTIEREMSGSDDMGVYLRDDWTTDWFQTEPEASAFGGPGDRPDYDNVAAQQDDGAEGGDMFRLEHDTTAATANVVGVAPGVGFSGGEGFRIEHDTDPVVAPEAESITPGLGSSRGDVLGGATMDGAEAAGLIPGLDSSRGDFTDATTAAPSEGEQIWLSDGTRVGVVADQMEFTDAAPDASLVDNYFPAGNLTSDAVDQAFYDVIDWDEVSVIGVQEPSEFGLPDMRGSAVTNADATNFQLEVDTDPFDAPLNLSTFEEMWVA